MAASAVTGPSFEGHYWLMSRATARTVGAADDERHALANGPVEAGRQVIKHDYAFASIGQVIDHVTADVTSATSYKD